MTATLVRVINGQRLPRSILIDKIDRAQGNFDKPRPYAQVAKQAIYVPYSNPIDPTVAGYIDLVPTDEVVLQLNQPKGVLAQLANKGYVTTLAHSGALTVAPVITASAHGVAGATGTNGAFAAAVGGVANFTDSTANAFAAGDVGKFITVSGSSHAVNNGTFKVTANTSSSIDVLQNPNAVLDAGPLDWALVGGTTITGTTLTSVTPDHTYVTLTNLLGASQILSDTAIIAAEGTVSATSIVIPDAIITIGTPAAGWHVQVQANSKKSNTFTMT